MINLQENLIRLRGQDYPIINFAVWFASPKGLHESIDAAKEICDDMDIPYEAIRAVPVAIAENNVYEIFP